MHIAPPERLHHLRDPVFLHRRDQQVDVVGHQHIGMDPAVGFLGRDGQVFEIAPVVLFSQKARFAVVAALNDVLGNARQGKTGFAGHSSPPCERAGMEDYAGILSAGNIREKSSLTRVFRSGFPGTDGESPRRVSLVQLRRQRLRRDRSDADTAPRVRAARERHKKPGQRGIPANIPRW